MGGSIVMGVSQKWWFILENPIKMDDLGVPLFQETPICAMLFLVLLDLAQYSLGLLVSASCGGSQETHLGLGPWCLEAWGKRLLLRSVSRWKTLLPKECCRQILQKTVVSKSVSFGIHVVTSHTSPMLRSQIATGCHGYFCWSMFHDQSGTFWRFVEGSDCKKNPPPLRWHKESTTNGVVVHALVLIYWWT